MSEWKMPENLGERYSLEGLPPELVKQLNKRGGHGLDYAIEPALAALDGIASTNELIVSLYRSTGRIYQRTAVQGALYRLCKAGKVSKQGEGLWRLNVSPTPPEKGEG